MTEQQINEWFDHHRQAFGRALKSAAPRSGPHADARATSGMAADDPVTTGEATANDRPAAASASSPIEGTSTIPSSYAADARLILKAKGWKEPEKYSDTDAIKRLLLDNAATMALDPSGWDLGISKEIQPDLERIASETRRAAHADLRVASSTEEVASGDTRDKLIADLIATKQPAASETPRTDALVERFRQEKLFDVDDALDLARQLERELAEASSDRDRLRSRVMGLENMVPGLKLSNVASSSAMNAGAEEALIKGSPERREDTPLSVPAPIASSSIERTPQIDVIETYHRLMVAEWEKAYQRPCAVPLPNDVEKAALIGLARAIEANLARSATGGKSE